MYAKYVNSHHFIITQLKKTLFFDLIHTIGMELVTQSPKKKKKAESRQHTKVASQTIDSLSDKIYE